MNKKNLIVTGVILMVLGALLPVIYFLLDIFSLGILTAVTFGMDLVCCCSVSPLVFIAGVILLIVGLVKKEDTPINSQPPFEKANSITIPSKEMMDEF